MQDGGAVMSRPRGLRDASAKTSLVRLVAWAADACGARQDQQIPWVVPGVRALTTVLRDWREGGCQLCVAYGHPEPEGHVLEECKRWQRSKQGKRRLRLIGGAKGLEPCVGGSHCRSCYLHSKMCRHVRGGRGECTAYDDAARAVAALMEVENGILVQGLADIFPWAEDGDEQEMEIWMGRQHGWGVAGVVLALYKLSELWTEARRQERWWELREGNRTTPGLDSSPRRYPWNTMPLEDTQLRPSESTAGMRQPFSVGVIPL